MRVMNVQEARDTWGERVKALDSVAKKAAKAAREKLGLGELPEEGEKPADPAPERQLQWWTRRSVRRRCA